MMTHLEKIKSCIEYSALANEASGFNTKYIKDEIYELANDLNNLKGSYVVFEDVNDELVQLSISLPTLFEAKTYADGCKNRNTYIYKLIEY